MQRSAFVFAVSFVLSGQAVETETSLQHAALQVVDTLTVSSTATSDSTVRFFIPGFGQLPRQVRFRSLWVRVHADTVEMPASGIVVLTDVPEVQLRTFLG